ncbi:hypothetical protein HU200_050421 [Digitaria exilis]|uniref:Uncharacterized protein n=1 Tax=Digitaria exilis TaxID=1010633 RepID=A0A835B2S1_9POAL|nr:hypothetical protein HU200_050421 [Digitaria exilis]
MVVATRVLVPDRTCTTRLDRCEPPPCSGSSSVRIRLFLSRAYSSRRLAGRSTTDKLDKIARKGEQIFYVYDPALFLSYDETRRAVHAMVASMPLLAGFDVSTDNWASCAALDAVATARRRRRVRRRPLPLLRGARDGGHPRVQRAQGGGARLRRHGHAGRRVGLSRPPVLHLHGGLREHQRWANGPGEPALLASIPHPLHHRVALQGAQLPGVPP